MFVMIDNYNYTGCDRRFPFQTAATMDDRKYINK